jgi:predicted phage terminase large subunit-like protein
MNADEQALRIARLYHFARHMFQSRKAAGMLENWHQREICNALERVLIGQTNRLIINVPPRSGKTEIAVKSFIAWAMGLFPDSEFIHASYSKRLAAANTYEVRAIMQSEAYKELFPWTSLQDDSKAKDEFRTAQGGVVYATGADGTITGYGASKMRPEFGGAIIIDDPHKAADAASPVMRQNVIDWYQNTIASRLNKPDGPIVIIMQRLHEEDLAGWLLAGGTGEKWEHLCIPARKSDGASFWPEQFPDEMLDRLERSSAYVFAGQYMQAPAPLGGGIFKDAWWQYLDAKPPIKWRAIYADTAQKTKEQNDNSVFQCWGYSHHGQAVLLDQIVGKWEAPELANMARIFWAKHKAADTEKLGTLRAFKVEDKVSGTGLIQTLKREGLPMLGIPRDKDKVTRAFDAAPMVEAGQVVLMRDVPNLADLISEAAVFPNGAHDDVIDCAMSAISDMLQGSPAPSIRSL